MAKGFEYRIDGGSAVDMGNVLTFPVTGLAAGTEYDFEVRKRDNAGNVSAWSSIVSATTDAAPFTPSDETGGVRWFKANDEVYSDNDPVGTMTDQFGVLSGTAAGGARPTFKTAIVNGQSVYRFDGLANVVALGDLSALTQAEIFIVVKIDGPDPPLDGAFSGLWELGSTGVFATHYPWTDGNVYEGFGAASGGRKTVGNLTPALTSWRIYSVYSAANDWAAYLDGVQVFSTGTNTASFPAAGKLGEGNGTAYHLDGDVAELVMYDHKLASGVRTDVIDYLKSEYGIA
jgi:chitodextrinase